MSLGSDFAQGFSTTRNARLDKKRLAFEQEQADQKAAEFQMNKETSRDAIHTERQDTIERNNRYLAAENRTDERRAADAKARSEDPRSVLDRERATQELNTLHDPAQQAAERELRQSALDKSLAISRFEKEQGYVQPAPAPRAKVKQAFGAGGKSTAEYEVPVSELAQTVGQSPANSYRSPYARDIADLGKQEAAQRAEMDGGDQRTGFMNMNSRADIAGQASRQRLRLQAMELQDMVSKGVIDQEEADRRADALMGTR